MLVEFDFAVTQTAYVKAAMDEIPAFRPDGLTPANVQTLVTSATPVRDAYVTKKNAIGEARTLRHTTIDTLHDACVDFAAQGRSRFRKNPGVLERFQRVPTQDETFQKTLTRAASSEALWTTLPQVGTPPAAFTVAQGNTTLALAGFTALIAAARSADGAIPASDEDFQSAEADLHTKMAELEDFVTAALEQGRSQFDPGTPQREIIDAIPNATGGGGPPGPTVPAKAQITNVTGDGTESVTIDYSAEGATLFDLYAMVPGSNDFQLIAGDLTGTQYTFSDVAGSPWIVKVVGKNTQGAGPESDEVSFSGPA